MITLAVLVSMVPATERFHQELIHDKIGGVVEYRLEDGTRVDILTHRRAIEIDWGNNWAEGVGQSIYYSTQTARPPMVILLARSSNWKRYHDRVEACGIECWVWSAEAMEFIYK